MSKATILERIKELFFEEQNPVVETTDVVEKEVELQEDYKNEIAAKLMDGTEVKILTKGEAVSIGDMVLVKSGEEFVKAPEGKHMLTGGMVIYVDAEGYINEIETEQTDATTEKDETAMEELFSSVEKLMDVVFELKKEIAEIKKSSSTLSEEFKKFSSEPQEESITKKNKPVLEKNASKEDKLKFFASRS
jgi:hypothetical protein